MSAKLFISQGTIDAWVSQDQADVSGDRLTLRGGLSLRLSPASLFRRVSGGTDVHGLVGRVKGEEAISALGAEAYMSSVILGDTAYDVEPGFLAFGADGQPAATLVSAVRAIGG
jgi:hypothetical protein